LPQLDAKALRLLVPRSSVLEDLDATVGKTFEALCARVSKMGARIEEVAVPAFDHQADYFKGGGYAGAEAYYIHRPYLERLEDYDPRVGKRILLGKDFTAADYIALSELRATFMRAIETLAAPYDAIVMP